MAQFISAVTLVVPDYDEALAFYVDRLGFALLEDTQLSDEKRWVRVAPPGAEGGVGAEAACLLLAKAGNERQRERIGDQTGGRVFFFLHTDDFARDYARYSEAGVHFVEEPRHEAYGVVVVFEDPFGNRWDLVEPKKAER